jgi:acetyl-CoA carboxylase carboxyltransferase component
MKISNEAAQLPYQERLDAEFNSREEKALAMGGSVKLLARAEQGILDARSRVEVLVDEGSFVELGKFAISSFSAEAAAKTPADGKITGYGKVNGRWCAVVSNDFTVMGASSSLTNVKKIAHMKRQATCRRMPMVFLGESSGARLPDNMGARDTPWAAAVLGQCYGSSFLYTCCADFSVIRKGAVMAVSSPRLIEMATNEKVDPQELGGWKVHVEGTGLIDKVVDSDEEAIEAIKTFLGYLPASNLEAPPVHPVSPGSGDEMGNILAILPEERTRVYDMRKIIKTIVDKDSFFELKERFGKVAVTALARIDGHTVGIYANNPIYKGGVLDVDACDKIQSFLVLCDSFNIPIVSLVDTPGFVIGAEAERRKATGKIVNFMNALQLVTVPKISVIIRKSYGQAFLNMGGGRNSDEVVAWPTAEVSFMTPRFAANIAYGMTPEDDGFEEALATMDKDNSVWEMAAVFAVQNVIRPQETRDYLIRALDAHRAGGAIGNHELRNWPTSY